jgi:hypothetical protein
VDVINDSLPAQGAIPSGTDSRFAPDSLWTGGALIRKLNPGATWVSSLKVVGVLAAGVVARENLTGIG